MPRAKGALMISSRARKALDEIFDARSRIEVELEELTEEDLKAVASDTRRYLKSDHDHIRLGIAAAADHQLAIRERRRKGDGKWFAVIEALEWNPDTDSGESKILAKTECDGKSAAVTEARNLLAKHASDFAEHTKIEAAVVCDLEMDSYYERDS
jgi:hypothetical protein